ncbi:sensor domain-containing protein [Mycobacterium hubeiense]|uniref:sensor domain-containing protein n=1 Tax=Mycobacterium hubeiense TaxID=1867256 RepID=UPI00130470C9|nr:sensor domain-containing protein [Mycobacterium sp. QGD 101]
MSKPSVLTIIAGLSVVVAIALAGTAFAVRGAGAPSPEVNGVPLADDKLTGLLSAPEEVAEAVGAHAMTISGDKAEMQGTDGRNADNACIGLLGAREDSAYKGSGWTSVRYRGTTDSGEDKRIGQVVVAFPDAAAAAGFVAKQQEVWTQQCANRVIDKLTAAESKKVNYAVGDVTNDDGILTATFHSEGGGNTCVRGLAWRNNIVIDVIACGVDMPKSVMAGLVVPVSARIEEAGNT